MNRTPLTTPLSFLRLPAVDWAQLAQQWIQMKDQPGAPSGGAPDGMGGGSVGDSVGSGGGGGGEADMELDDGGRDDAPPLPGQSFSHWHWHHTRSVIGINAKHACRLRMLN